MFYAVFSVIDSTCSWLLFFLTNMQA